MQRDEAFRQILRHHERTGDRFELLGEVLAKFVCEEDFADVKACEGHSCTLVFADHTRGRARRWCSTAICGNRAKQVAHRNRLKNKHRQCR
jgi:predicted RNA-binding Zn ribbon-like protein